MARPEKEPDDRKENILRIRLTEGERDTIDRAANGKSSTWAREVLLREAARLAKRTGRDAES